MADPIQLSDLGFYPRFEAHAEANVDYRMFAAKVSV